MNKHFTITINDDDGVKQFNLHKIIKKIVLYIVVFILSFGFLSVGAVFYLKSSMEKIEQKKLSLTEAYKKLEKQNQDLQVSIDLTNTSLIKKKKELDELSDSLSEIEGMIGIKPLEQSSLKERVDVAKINSQNRALLLQLIPNGSPVQYKGITSKFGYRIHPTLHKREFHRGLDLKAKMKTPIYATADGIVEWAGYHKRSGFGRLIILTHIYGFKTYFGHLNKVVVKSGQFVKKGDLIGYSGNSGLSNGPHLHYEIRFIQRPLNPYFFLRWTQKHYDEIFKKEQKVPWQSLIMAVSRLRISKQIQTQQ